MQLKAGPSLREALTAVTAVLLGSNAAQAVGERRLESSLLLYSESDRVQAAEGLIGLTIPLKGERTISTKFTFDGLTGASPNGATPSNQIQTFTRPSGNGSYTTPPGTTPLDDTFRDTRVGLDGSFSQPLGRLSTLTLGGHLSSEHDYTSLGANIGLTHDLNRKNTTLAVSAAFGHDIVRPEGGAPTPLASMQAADDDEGEVEGEDDDDEGEHGESSGKGKDILDAVVGVTQVIDSKTLLRLNYSFNRTSGYLNDPYKLLSVVEGPTAGDPGRPVDYIFESRPDSRTKHAVYAQIRRYFGGHVIDVAYRYFWDSWGIRSNTVDLSYRIPLPSEHALQPHFRWYRQSEASFYHAYLIDGSPVPPAASADYRLAPFHAVTAGLKYIFPVAPGAHMSFGAEYYHQVGDLSPPTSFGMLNQYELFPQLNAVMIRMGLSYDF